MPRAAPSCIARRATSWSGWGSPTSASCRTSPRCCRSSTTATTSPSRWPPRCAATTPPTTPVPPPPEPATAAVRLRQVLAEAGIASRRRCEQLMAEGPVEVNGEIVTQMGARVDPVNDVIRVDGRRVPPKSDHAYLMVNKPRGVVSSMSDERGRPDLRSLLPDRAERLFHVGRLDTDTSGLLLVTNDGDLAHRLAHPSFEVTKTYV